MTTKGAAVIEGFAWVLSGFSGAIALHSLAQWLFVGQLTVTIALYAAAVLALAMGGYFIKEIADVLIDRPVHPSAQEEEGESL